MSRMIISLIAAVDKNTGIGYRGTIPWHVSSDLKRFKEITLNHHILMGRLTYQSIGRPLPGRVNLVLSQNLGFLAPGCYIFNQLESTVRFAYTSGENELFVIGGGEVFRQFFPFSNKIYLTKVLEEYKCDTFFPDIVEDEWNLIEKIFVNAETRDDCDSIFQIYQRKSNSGILHQVRMVGPSKQ